MGIKMKKGKYYIGDPSYVFGDSWGDILTETNYFGYGECKIRGKAVLGCGTAYGDGIYRDNEGRIYLVDSGVIAILPISMLKIDNTKTIAEIEKSEGMHIINFKDEFTAECENGRYRFGNIVIDTSEESDDE